MKTALKAMGMLLAIALFLSPGTAKASSWGFISFAPKIGYAYYGESKGTAISNSLSARNAMNVQFNIDLFGPGLGFDLGVYYALQKGQIAGNDTTFHALGLNWAMVYRIDLDPAYIYLGIGNKTGYLMADHIDHGLEIYGRIPFGFTYYFSDSIALVLEVGGGYGVTGTLPKEGLQINSIVGKTFKTNFDFGHGMYFDAMAGLRFP